MANLSYKKITMQFPGYRAKYQKQNVQPPNY